jgi:hypothetical protein
MFLIGMPARLRPITATTAPVTTGGMKRSIQPVPTACTSAPMIDVDDAAGDDAAQRHADVAVGPLPAYAVAAITTPMKAKLEPR